MSLRLECVPKLPSEKWRPLPCNNRLSDQVAQLSRDLGLGPDCGAPAAQFPPHAPSSADAARATLVKEECADERINRSNTESSRARGTRRLMVEPVKTRRTNDLCQILADHAANQPPMQTRCIGKKRQRRRALESHLTTVR